MLGINDLLRTFSLRDNIFLTSSKYLAPSSRQHKITFLIGLAPTLPPTHTPVGRAFNLKNDKNVIKRLEKGYKNDCFDFLSKGDF